MTVKITRKIDHIESAGTPIEAIRNGDMGFRDFHQHHQSLQSICSVVTPRHREMRDTCRLVLNGVVCTICERRQMKQGEIDGSCSSI